MAYTDDWDRDDNDKATIIRKTPRQAAQELGISDLERETFFDIMQLPTYTGQDAKLQALGELDG